MDRRDVLKSGLTLAAATALGELEGASAKARETAMKKYSNTVTLRDGTRLFWKEWGEGRPVLFLNSAGVNTALWQYQVTAFAPHGLRCINFDRRGHGRSDVPPSGYDYSTLADDVAEVIAALDLSDVVLIGHSMGCGEAVRYIARHGKRRVSRLVLLSPTTPFMLQTADNPNGIPAAAIEALRKPWYSDYPGWIAANTDPFFVPETSPAMKAWGQRMLADIPLPVAIACNQAVMTEDFRAELPKLDVPTLIIHGDKDVSAPIDLTGRPTTKLIPGAQLKVYEGAPHGLMFTHMEKLHADVLGFI